MFTLGWLCSCFERLLLGVHYFVDVAGMLIVPTSAQVLYSALCILVEAKMPYLV
ncbi:hypothetical protein N431DRAFT_438765 [Stipitochalara longipes BDJ]|nr:hypothetical protein N431DRAFT_438765 [Stipitochalara longipes BDJ]